MENINLSNFLKTLGSDNDICIGAKNGSAFMFFGKAKDSKEIKKIFDDYKKEKEENVDRIKLTMTDILNNHDPAYMSNCMSIARVIVNYYSTISHINKYIKEYKNPLKRTVVKSYTKEIDNCTCIIIEGEERGQYWFKEEYDRDHK